MLITIIQGHPDPGAASYGHALASAYAEGARAAGHTVELIDVARLDFPLLRTQEDWTSAAAPPALQEAQRAIASAEHIVIFFPLWLGTMPALLKAFLEQVLRPGFAIEKSGCEPNEEDFYRPGIDSTSVRRSPGKSLPCPAHRQNTAILVTLHANLRVGKTPQSPPRCRDAAAQFRFSVRH